MKYVRCAHARMFSETKKKLRVFSHCLLLGVYESASEHYLTIGVYNKVRLQTESKKKHLNNSNKISYNCNNNNNNAHHY